MAKVIRMPRMSDTMEQGTLVQWFKQSGDAIKSGDVLAEVETDKAVMELESYDKGVLLHLAVQAGDSIPVDAVIAVIGEKGEDYAALLESESSSQPSSVDSSPKAAADAIDSTNPSAPTPVDQASPAEVPFVPQDSALQTLPAERDQSDQSDQGGRLPKASPLARKMAEDKGYDLARIEGSGDYGRIIKRDILAYRPVSSSVGVLEDTYEVLPLSTMRQTIASRLAASKFSAPHFYLNVEANVTELLAYRKRINGSQGQKVSFNDMILKACAGALRVCPQANQVWDGGSLRVYDHVHLGIAVSLPGGLLVPVLRFADTKSLLEIAAETSDLIERAQARKLQADELTGSTFSVSNLGMFAIERFTAIINTPNVAILAVGQAIEKPVVTDQGLGVGRLLYLTLSCDHRALDGVAGAKFLKELKALLEDPVRLLL